MGTSAFNENLERNDANFAPLTPLTLIRRAASVYPRRTAVIHGSRRFTWAETYARCRRLASALALHGVGKDDTVAVMAANVPALYEAHFGVPMAGAVLNAINTRLDASTIAYILNHGEASVLLTDREFAPVVKEALENCESTPLVIDIDDEAIGEGEFLGEMEYEDFIATGDPEFEWSPPTDEWDSISLNYTSGTTGDPKGVVYHHRGAYMLAIGNILTWSLPPHPVYLWTLPMFHCNGWCFPWTLAAVAGTSVCLRKVTAGNIFTAIHEDGVTRFCGAPIVLNLVINATDEERGGPLPHQVEVMTAAAPPPATVLQRMAEQGFQVTHVYGLTEVYGPATVCAWHEEWSLLPLEEQAALKARQGVGYTVLEDMMVADPNTLEPVPCDGQTMGEVMLRGNIVMKGYLKNRQATEDAFQGGWFHSGDLGVVHSDGYIELRDRAKDIIISGGENISTIEVESVLYRHPAVLEAAVVARPDDKWGETPCAFVTLKESENTSEEDIIGFCRDNIAHFKCPKTVIFGDLPKTSTGKVQKYVLREKAKEI